MHVVKLSNVKSADEVLGEQMEESAFRLERERTGLERAVMNPAIDYRAQHGLSQAALIRTVRMSQPLVARLDAGEHERWTSRTLTRLSRLLSVELQITTTPTTIELTAKGHRRAHCGCCTMAVSPERREEEQCQPTTGAWS